MKMHTFSRRRFIKSASTGTSIALLPNLFQAFAIAAESVRVDHYPLGASAHLLTLNGTNVVCVSTSAGALLIDGFDAANAHLLIDAVAEHTNNGAIAVLCNTHWHWEHTGSNEIVRDTGAKIISHENTRLWMGAEFYVDWQDRLYTRRSEQALPTETFYETHTFKVGDEAVHCGHLPQAHTDGDIYVSVPGRNLLVAGGLVADGCFPEIDPSTGGWIGGLVKAQARLLELADDRTQIIPAMGAPQSRGDLQRQHEMLVEMKSRLYEMVKKGMSAKEMLQARVAEGLESWGDPTQFVMNAYQGMWLHYKDIDGAL